MNRKPNQPPDFRKQVWLALFKSLIIPVSVLIFFAIAPSWLNQKLRRELTDSVNRNPDLTVSQRAERLDKISQSDFQSICSDDPPAGLEKLHDALIRAGVRGNFQRLQWGLILSVVLVLGLSAAILTLSILNNRAAKSQDDLVQAYRTSWKIVIITALVNVFLLIPLLTYGSFEFTVLLWNQYLPKLLILIVLGGIFALWRSASILLKPVPLEFAEPMAREVSPGEAPLLWRAVRYAAERLHTAPPDRILIGLQLNFYVTELAVKYDGGRAEGKTLFLSFPLMKLLSEDEVMAIIGHELGHFIGEDTRLTREFYPLRFKVHGTMVAMGQSSWVGWPSFQFLNYFNARFGETEQTVSRQRELLADQKAAELTSPRTMAQALIRFQVAAEAFQRGLKQLADGNQQSILDLPLHAIIQEKLASEPAFWNQLFEKKLPHPLDSHPSLQVRLDALGQTVEVSQAQAIALATEPSAYDQWLANHPALFTRLTQHAEAVAEKLRAVHADYETEAGKQLLDKHFPEQKWTTKSSLTWFLTTIFGLFGGFFLLMALCIDGSTAKLICGPLFFLCLVGIFFAWKLPRSTELTLNAQGLKFGTWKRPLLFKDVDKIAGARQYSNIILTFHLKEKQPPYRKSWFGFPVKKVTLALGTGMPAKPLTVAETILKYYQRVAG